MENELSDLKSEILKLNIINEKLKIELREKENSFQHVPEKENKRKLIFNDFDESTRKVLVEENYYLNRDKKKTKLSDKSDQNMEWESDQNMEVTNKESCLQEKKEGKKLKNVVINNYFYPKMDYTEDRNTINNNNKVNDFISQIKLLP